MVRCARGRLRASTSRRPLTSQGCLVVLRAGPPSLRRAAALLGLHFNKPALAALALGAAGDLEGARLRLETVIDAPCSVSSAVLRRVADAAVTLHLVDVARRAVDRMPLGGLSARFSRHWWLPPKAI